MCQNTCGSCTYFRQHYILNQRKIVRIHFGHCTFRRARAKQPDAKICEHYTPAPPDEDAFVSKEYLSKELLRYVMALELLPEIENRL